VQLGLGGAGLEREGISEDIEEEIITLRIDYLRI
jgi:hypothetical protein